MYDSKEETTKHIDTVQRFMAVMVGGLLSRAIGHDESKLTGAEKECFDMITPGLKGLTYGSDEYRAVLKEMTPAIKLHYESNRHHPEHFGAEGINGMTLVDLVEMLCDWKAATLRHADGDMGASLEHNAGRFGIDPQLARILLNTVKALRWS